jgi:glycosyltransferase involved in cell wall biosynthesis
MSHRRICLALPSFYRHDAVGNDVLGMKERLEAAGYDVTIYATWMDSAYSGLATLMNPRDSIWRSPDTLLIYHHAIYWEAGEEMLDQAKAQLAIRYHNVTPPHFFEGHAQHYFDACTAGLAATERLARRADAWFWGASSFNVEDLVRFGAREDRCRVVPPFDRIEEELACTPFDNVIAGENRQVRANILFVGGFRPNKGHRKAVETFAAYRRLSDTPARLLLVGTFDPALKDYMESVQNRAVELDVAEDLRFLFSATPSQLRTHYMTSTVFLCTSEHEGFCVPLTEAMYFRVPIVAWHTTAVPETCGTAALGCRDFDPQALASAIDECVENPAIARRLAQCGRAQYESRFCRRVAGQRLLELVREMERA